MRKSRCQVGGCSNPPSAKSTWGTYPHGDRSKAILCEVHLMDLWKRIKGAVSLGEIHYEACNADE